MDSKNLKRVRIITVNDQAGYYVPAWLGWKILRHIVEVMVVLIIILAVFILMLHHFASAFSGDDWFSRVARFMIPLPVPLVLLIVIPVAILCSPLMVMCLLSSKRIWLDGGYLHVKKKFLGWTRHKRIPVEDIIDITLSKDGSKDDYIYKIVAKYRLNLPRWLVEVIPKKVDFWFATLLDAIPTKQEAELIRDELLTKVLTQIDTIDT